MDKTNKISVLFKINPFLIFLQIFGLQYFSIEEAANPKKRRKIHPKYVIYYVVLMSLVVGSYIGQSMRIPKTDHSKDTSKLMVRKSIAVIIYFLLYMTSFTILSQSIAKTPQQIQALKIFDKIAEMSWNKVCHKIDYGKFMKRFIIKFVLLSILFVTPIIVSLTIDRISGRYKNRISRPWFIILPFFIVDFMNVKHIFYADLISFHILQIKRILLKKTCLELFHVTVLQENFRVTKNALKHKNEPIADKVYIAKKMYGLIKKATGCINETMGWSILLSLVFSSFAVICNAYIAFILYQRQAPLHEFTGSL